MDLDEEREDKFKFALLQVDKRLVNLEIAVGEINEKMKSVQTIDAQTIQAIEERLDELEDLIMLENLGEIELKKLLESLESRTRESSERTRKLEEEVKKLSSRLESSESPMIKKIEQEIFELKDKNTQLASKDDLKKLEERIEEKKADDKILALEEKIRALESSLPFQKMGKLETEFSELKEKVSSIPTEIIEPVLLKKAEEEISSLKDKLAGLESKIKQSEEINKGLISLEGKMIELEKKIGLREASILKGVEEKFSALSLLSEQMLELREEFSKFREELNELSARTEQIVSLQAEIKRLNERMRPLETQVIQRLASEISDLRAETSQEIKEIKDKINGIIATKSEIDIKFLSSRLNSLKENVDYLLNRKAEFDMKIDSLQKALVRLVQKVEEIASGEVSTPVEERLKRLEEKVETMPSEIFENLKGALSKLEGKIKTEKTEKGSGTSAEIEAEELLRKISSLENKLMSLEENVKGTGSKPFVVE